MLCYVTRTLHFASCTRVRSLMLGHWYGTQTLHFRCKIEYSDVSDTWTRTGIRHQYPSPSNIDVMWIMFYNVLPSSTKISCSFILLLNRQKLCLCKFKFFFPALTNLQHCCPYFNVQKMFRNHPEFSDFWFSLLRKCFTSLQMQCFQFYSLCLQLWFVIPSQSFNFQVEDLRRLSECDIVYRDQS